MTVMFIIIIYWAAKLVATRTGLRARASERRPRTPVRGGRSSPISGKNQTNRGGTGPSGRPLAIAVRFLTNNY
eukprot:2890961-Heterocapsa_arctica.AAC.1